VKLTKLHSVIEDKKNELIQLVIEYGINHKKVLTLSRELDCLIFKFMKGQ